ncbi:MAG: hypothetical protein DDT23_00983 [candidate division WS2 bacterium]|nr:hypothetical protein [Candidatus Lithacetigena glycinireducens]
MKLRNCYFCVECEELFEGFKHCPSCSNRTVIPIQQWLYRTRQPETTAAEKPKLPLLLTKKRCSECE